MKHQVTYHESTLPGSDIPLGVVAELVNSALLGEHVVYERDDRWYIAADPITTITVEAGLVRGRSDGLESTSEWAGTPWAEVRSALDQVQVDGWNAYGWACFEVASGRHAGLDRLAHVMVPSIEVVVSAEQVLVRTLDEAVGEKIRAVVSAAADAADRDAVPVDVRIDEDRYRDQVVRAVQNIHSGRLQKVIVSRRVDVPFEVDLTATYVVGRRNNTPARSFLLDLGGWRVAGFSPETVVEVSTTGSASTQPLAGTRARTGDQNADRARRAELTADPKEVFEHATSVKLAFEELARVGRTGTTKVSEFLAVKARGSVQHLASRVDTVLAERATAWDALAAVFPSVTASGIPKRPAYDVIAELEDTPRGMYAGAVLMAGSDGSLDAALVLRAVYERDGQSWLRAGAGIVADSRPAREYEETCEKLASVAPYLVPAEGKHS